MGAPGQITQRHITSARKMLNLPTREDAKHFHLFGTPISKSPSPTMHNTAFQLLGLPHTYTLIETNDVKRIQQIINASHFGGASVTIPMKEMVQPLLSRLTNAAERIGAV